MGDDRASSAADGGRWHGQASMPLEDADILPSRWGVRRSGQDLIDWYVRETTQRSRETRSRLAGAQLDIRFGPGPRECVDLFPAAAAAEPGNCSVLFWHGGYWVEGERQAHSFVSEPFVAAGVSVAVAGYPLAPSAAGLDDLVDSATRCARHVLATLNGPLVLAGHSAGAQLAAAVAARIAHEEPERVRGLLLLSPVLDVEALLGSSVATQAAIDGGQATRNSPVRLSDRLPTGPRFHVQVVLAEHDPPWFQRTARAYCKDLEGRGVRCELLEYAQEDHFSYLLGPFLDAGHPVTRRIVQACSCTPGC